MTTRHQLAESVDLLDRRINQLLFERRESRKLATALGRELAAVRQRLLDTAAGLRDGSVVPHRAATRLEQIVKQLTLRTEEKKGKGGKP